MPVIPATQDAETGELLEPGGGGCSEPRLGHRTPAWATDRLHLKKQHHMCVCMCVYTNTQTHTHVLEIHHSA